jgi:molecular chaperone GrpE
VLDNFERALQVEKTEETASLINGISMVYRQLQDALTSNGVETMETEGQEFDPNLHHAVMQVEDDAFEANHIVEELQKGYVLKDRVIRPAMVKVNK